MLWQQSQATHLPPSDLLGLTRGSYEAYCFDQAVWYFGTTITSELEKAGHKPQKGERAMESARKRVLKKYLGETSKQQYADPSAILTQE